MRWNQERNEKESGGILISINCLRDCGLVNAMRKKEKNGIEAVQIMFLRLNDVKCVWVI